MIVVITKSIPLKIKGYISKHIFSIDNRIFVGKMTSNKRTVFINYLKMNINVGGCLIIWTENNIYGFNHIIIGNFNKNYDVIELDNIEIFIKKFIDK